MALTIELTVWVTLTAEEIKLVDEHIVKKRNKRNCYKYAKMDSRTFEKMLLGHPVTEDQKKRVMEFAAHVANGK